MLKIYDETEYPQDRIEGKRLKTKSSQMYISSVGRFTFNKLAKDLLNLSDKSRVLLSTNSYSENNPEDNNIEWLIMNVTQVEEKRGYVIKEILSKKEGKESRLEFISLGLAKQILKNYDVNIDTIKFIRININNTPKEDFGTGDLKNWFILDKKSIQVVPKMKTPDVI